MLNNINNNSNKANLYYFLYNQVNLSTQKGIGSISRIYNFCDINANDPIYCLFQFTNPNNNNSNNNLFQLGSWRECSIYRPSSYLNSYIPTNPILYNVGEWFQIICNSTGQYILAIDSNNNYPGIYVSNDYGVSFTLNSSTYHDYSGLSITNSGEISYVPAIRDQIFTSTNYSESFYETDNDKGGFWYKVACSSNGKIVAIVKNFNNSGGSTSNPIFISTNYAQSFYTSFNKFYSWSSIAMNSSGSIIASCSYDGYVYLTINGGSKWTKQSLPAYCWSSISMDSSGANIWLCSLDGYIYFSSNTGSKWTSCAPSTLIWSCITISSSANVIFACAVNNNIYYSSNNGQTWTSTSPNNSPSNWSSITTNSDGTLVTACVNGGNIYINS